MPAQKDRLIGFDILKIMAAYGVVVIHGLGDVPKGFWADRVSSYFLIFSVPTFLMMAFYFTTATLYAQKDQPRDDKAYLLKRCQRILVPFYLWSIIYLVFRLIKQILLHDHSLAKILMNPGALLMGSAGVQLYFLPLLFTGTIAALFITKSVKQNALWTPILLLAISLGLNALFQIKYLHQTVNILAVIAVENLTQSLDNTALMHALFFGLQIVLAIWFWIIYCIPYICISILLLNTGFRSKLSRFSNLRIVGLIVISIVIVFNLVVISQNIVLMFCIPTLFILLAIVVSEIFKIRSSLIQKMSELSFGIYLIHGLITAGINPIFSKFNLTFLPPLISLPRLLIVAAVIFMVSAVASALIMRHRRLARLLFGV